MSKLSKETGRVLRAAVAHKLAKLHKQPRLIKTLGCFDWTWLSTELCTELCTPTITLALSDVKLVTLVHRSQRFFIIVSSASNKFSAVAIYHIGIPRNLVTALPITSSQYWIRIANYFRSILSFPPWWRQQRNMVRQQLLSLCKC